MTTGNGAADFLKAGSCRVAFVESRDESAFKASLGDLPDIAIVTRVGGVNLNGGRKLDIAVYLRGAV